MCTHQFLHQMTSDFDESWYDIQVGIKDGPKMFGSDICMHMHATYINVHAHFNNQ